MSKFCVNVGYQIRAIVKSSEASPLTNVSAGFIANPSAGAAPWDMTGGLEFRLMHNIQFTFHNAGSLTDAKTR